MTMATAAATSVFRLFRCFPSSVVTTTNNKPSSFLLSNNNSIRFLFFVSGVQFSKRIPTLFKSSIPPPPTSVITRLFSSRSSSNTNTTKTFAFSDSDDDQPQAQAQNKKVPPPYDPFSKKPVIVEPKDPKDLQEIFHNMRTEGLINNAVKMFDALSKDGLTHEAMELLAEIKDKSNMPDVVAHTAVIEAYANAGGHTKEALKVFLRMLSSGVKPNAYTYTVLIKGLSKDAKLGDASKYILEMMDRGIQPNAGTYTTVFEAFAMEDKLEEGKELLEKMKAKGFVPNEKAVRDHQVLGSVINMLFPSK